MPTLHRSYTHYQCNSANSYGAGERRTISSCIHCHGSRRQAGRAALVKQTRRSCDGMRPHTWLVIPRGRRCSLLHSAALAALNR